MVKKINNLEFNLALKPNSLKKRRSYIIKYIKIIKDIFVASKKKPTFLSFFS
jgi:hypothetical protein